MRSPILHIKNHPMKFIAGIIIGLSLVNVVDGITKGQFTTLDFINGFLMFAFAIYLFKQAA